MKRKIALLLILVLLLPCCTGCRAEVPATCYRGGYGQAPIPVDLESGTQTYYVAGYRNNHPAAGILDPQYVKAFLLDAGGKDGPVLLLSVDCVGLSSGTVAELRRALRPECRKVGCRNIQIMSTHDHAGADTLGLWGPEGINGKNPSFLKSLREAARDAVRQAIDSVTDGDLYFGSIDTGDAILEDTRLPAVYDSRLYSFRFQPKDAAIPPVRLLNYAAHAESLDSDNNLLSADFPAVVADLLAQADGSRTLWFPGAIGGLLRTRFLDQKDKVQNRQITGQNIAAYVLKIENERKLEVSLTAERTQFEVRCENTLFQAMKFLGVLDHRSAVRKGDVYLRTELNCLVIGGIPILLVPGEVFPELIYGYDPGYTPLQPERTLPPIDSLFDGDLLVFGLANDEIGYIVPPDSFLLNRKLPYLDTCHDGGENHYEETNSPGPDTAASLFEAAQNLAEKLRSRKTGR